MALDESVSSLIGRIYESAGDQERWDRVILDVKERLGACAVLQTVADLRHRELSRTTFLADDENSAFAKGVRRYEEGYYLEDPTFQFATANPNGRYCDTEAIIPADEYLEHSFINFNRRTLGATHWMVGYTAPENDLSFSFSIHQPSSRGALSQEQKQLFKILFEHMERAIRLAARPILLASKADAVILLDRRARVCDVSLAAEALLATGDGLAISDKQLHATTCIGTQQLHAAIASALNATRDGGWGEAVSVPRPSGKRDLMIIVTPVLAPSLALAAYGCAVLVKIIDQDVGVSPTAPHRWQKLFGFTAAEAKLGQQLMTTDQNLAHAAEALGIAYSTARVHLSHMLEKTRLHSQSQLARLLTLTEC